MSTVHRILPLALTLALAAACSDKSTGDSGVPGDGGSDGGTSDGGSDGGTDDVDSDGDGTLDADDCAPDDPAIHPGATEVCDDVDNDCDGTTDGADAVDATLWYADADSDTFGDIDDPGTAACSAPAGSLADNSDCDDTDPLINPGAAERCNGGDDDCDGETDEAGADGEVSWYLDLDGDGYGDSDDAALGCDAPSGRVGDDSDCDDSEGLVNPGQAEVCSDGLDNDCDGTGAGCLLEGAAVASDADSIATGSAASDSLGVSTTAVGDMDGDGIDDLLVGALYGAAGGTAKTGSAYLYLGSLSGLDTTATASVSGTRASDLFGWALDRAYDTDNDGFNDILVSSYAAGSTSAGAAYLFRGPLSGNTVASDADAQLVPIGSGTYFGWRAVGAGDLDDDGNSDLLVTGPGPSASSAGAAYVFLGPVSGVLNTAAADATLTGVVVGDWTGGAASGPGDLDGDGLDDIAISGENHDVTTGGLEGQVYLWFGAVSGSIDLAEADVIITGVDVSDGFGWEQSGAGDVDGDGYLDYAVSTPVHSSYTGAAWLFRGPLSPGTWSASLADATIEGTASGEYFGQGVRGKGDVDGDGSDDLVISATSGSDRGAAHLYYGPISGTMTSSDAGFTVTGDASGDALGSSIAINGDLNGDGRYDLVIGAPYESSAASYAGAFYVFYPADW